MGRVGRGGWWSVHIRPHVLAKHEFLAPVTFSRRESKVHALFQANARKLPGGHLGGRFAAFGTSCQEIVLFLQLFTRAYKITGSKVLRVPFVLIPPTEYQHALHHYTARYHGHPLVPCHS